MLTNQTTEQHCPRGSVKPLALYCKPYIQDQSPAPTAESLMRSRYTAFVLGSTDYLLDRIAPQQRTLTDRAIITEQMQLTTWTGLTIIDTHAGKKEDLQGTVEFEASFKTQAEQCILHERSTFCTKDGYWFYVDKDIKAGSI